MRDTWLYQNHRDWLLAPSDLPPELQYQEKDGFYLLDLGNPAALDWAKTTFSGIVGSYGIDIYRQDFNMTPLYFWRNGEAAGRQGMNEIRHVTGLYDLYDTLIREHPGLLIDNCASGGRRIDFEIMRRALSLFRSDCCWDPIGEQCMNYGISPWAPVTGVGAVTLDPYAFRSGMGSHMSLALDFYNKPELWDQLAATLKQYLTIRRLFTADFFPLTPYSLEKDKWIAWQYQDPEKGEGLIQAFRRDACPADTTKVKLRGLNPSVRYAVKNLDSGESETREGGQWMTDGLSVRIPTAPGAALLHLQAVPQTNP
jgi:alpha-galactosidase